VILGDRFDAYRYTVTIIGGYHQLGEFLANVGSLPRIVAPVNFSIVQGSANAQRAQARTSEKGALAATVTLQAYVEKTAPTASTLRERTS
jgi:type IV pilus assembly protein PilO